MLLVLILFFPLVAALLTYVSGNKLASKVALGLSVIEFAISLIALKGYLKYDSVLTFSYHNWIANPKIYFAISADGLSLLMVLLTTFLVPVIILSSFGKETNNPRSLFALVLLMQFALIGVFVAMDGFLYYIFWELALIPIYFISLLWGDSKDKEFRNTAIFKFFVYTLAGSLFMLVAFIYLYTKAGSFMLSDLYTLQLSNTEQCWLAAAFFFAFAIKIPIFLSLIHI